jgi:hypothetical protein
MELVEASRAASAPNRPAQRGVWLVLGNEPHVAMRFHLHQEFPPFGLRTLSLREDEPYQSAMVRAGIAASDDLTNPWRSPYMPDVLAITL